MTAAVGRVDGEERIYREWLNHTPMADEIQIRDALPDRSLRVSEAEALVDSSGEDSVLPSSVLTGESGDQDVVGLLVDTTDTVYALGFDPEDDAWVVFETWDGGDGFDRAETVDRVEEWVLENYDGAERDEIWNPSA